MILFQEQVPRRELCQSLRDAGVPQYSYFFWYENSETWTLERGDLSSRKGDCLAAFTVAEMGEQLKPLARMPEWNEEKQAWEWYQDEVCMVREPIEADARAVLLLWATREGLLKPEAN